MDHEQEARQRQIEICRAITPEEKYRQIMELRAFAREVKRAGVKSMHSYWTDEQVEAEVREIFLYARS
jgi:hypothetical protein